MNPRDEEQELRRLESALRAIDPGRKAAASLSERGRKRVLWSARHPFLAWCMLHHTAISSLVAVALLSGLLLWLLSASRAVREREQIPEAISAPVEIK